MATRAITGAKCRVYVNGAAGRKLIAWASGVSWTVQHQNVRVDVLGDHLSKEIEPVGVTVNGSFDMLRGSDQETLAGLGVSFDNGSTADFTNAPSFLVEVYNEADDKQLAVISGCRIGQASFQLQARGILSRNVSFEAISITEAP